jgi:hypothetical protein
MVEEAFIIAHIGDEEMDAVCDAAIIPAIERAGLVARRVDRHNTGDLLKSEIVAFIERCSIIVADLTNERPNCYLEVGYTMGVGKKPNLILTVREDHHHESPNYVQGGPKVHFDLSGYDLLFWHPDHLDEFRDELEKRIKRRLAIVRPPEATQAPDLSWVDDLRARAAAGLESVGLQGSMEVLSTLRSSGSWSQGQLLDALRGAQIGTFGWPLAPVLGNFPPVPTADGVSSEIAIAPDHPVLHGPQYDLWMVRRDGSLYALTSLFEDERDSTHSQIFFNTRIVRITEAVLLTVRLYSRLGVSETTTTTIRVTHSGLRGRTLGSTGARSIGSRQPTQEDTVVTSVTRRLLELETDAVEVVQELVAPLLTVFDFFAVDDAVLAEIVNDFIDGHVT